QRHITEQVTAFLVITAHCLASNLRLRYFPSFEGVFQQPARKTIPHTPDETPIYCRFVAEGLPDPCF
ncbi:hypothetical protein, partial [Seongchinamella sediminis]|uniref:hypothetical protein n=1 Tax=Seongchinamella sediminis TaxID=2283635 RepID=UPI00196890DB